MYIPELDSGDDGDSVDSLMDCGSNKEHVLDKAVRRTGEKKKKKAEICGVCRWFNFLSGIWTHFNDR